MKVLVTSTPGTGHVHPLVPLAAALQLAGHDVLWAVADEGCERVGRYGFEVAPAGMGVAARRAVLAPQMPEIMSMDPRLRRGPLFSGFFALAAAPTMRFDLAPIFDSFVPDIVVHEIAELAAAPMAVARGLPHATVAFGGAIPDGAIPALLDTVAPVWGSEDLGAPSMADIAGDLYLHPFPSLLGQVPSLGVAQPMRPGTLIASRDDEVPAWIASFGVERHGIYITAGTEVTAVQAPWRAAFEALGSMDVDAIATIGAHVELESLGAVPANIRIERYVPLHLVLDRASIVMSHGGAGTMLAAASSGIPQMVIPIAADQWENADAIAGSGAAMICEPQERDTESLRAGLQRLRDDCAYRDAASRVAAEIALMPSPGEHVGLIEALASR